VLNPGKNADVCDEDNILEIDEVTIAQDGFRGLINLRWSIVSITPQNDSKFVEIQAFLDDFNNIESITLEPQLIPDNSSFNFSLSYENLNGATNITYFNFTTKINPGVDICLCKKKKKKTNLKKKTI
jgi:hypothetical protein